MKKWLKNVVEKIPDWKNKCIMRLQVGENAQRTSFLYSWWKSFWTLNETLYLKIYAPFVKCSFLKIVTSFIIFKVLKVVIYNNYILMKTMN